MDERNVFSVTGDLSQLTLNQLPINSTHNTLIRHRNILRESVVKETHCMIADLVISTIKNPVFMEIDMISQSGEYKQRNDCNTGTNACKIKHGFTSSSDFKDFLTTVANIYSKCFKEGLKPYPLILGFDVPESCSLSIMGEINTVVNVCLPKKNKSLSLMCGKKIKKLDRKMAFFDLPDEGTVVSENMFRLNETKSLEQFTAGESNSNRPGRVNVQGANTGETGTETFECSEKKLKDLMGKIIFRTKSDVLKNDLEKNKYLYVNYFSSKKVYKSGTRIKYPTFENNYGENMTRIYPGISGSSLLMSPFSFQQQISLDIMKKVTELLNKNGDNAGITGFETFAGFAQEEFKGFGGNETENVTAMTEKATLTTIPFEDLNDKEKTKTKSTLTSVNFISYNYPVKKKKPQEYIDLQESFYNFYNPNPNPDSDSKSDVNNRLTHFETVTNSIINVNESLN
jgi:hypothetical protein